MSDDIKAVAEMADEVHAILRVAILAMETNLIHEAIFPGQGSGISPSLEIAEEK